MSDPRLPTQIKQPWEERLYDFDFRSPEVRPEEHLVPDGRSIASVDSVDVMPSTPSGDETLEIVGQPATNEAAVVQARFKGGANGEDYRIRVRVVDDLNQKIEGDAVMQVRDL